MVWGGLLGEGRAMSEFIPLSRYGGLAAYSEAEGTWQEALWIAFIYLF